MRNVLNTVPKAVCLLALSSVFLFSCAPDASQDGLKNASGKGTLTVVATTSIVADLIRQIGGEQVRVNNLMGPGVDPHLYKASEGDVIKMARADVIFYNGLHLEGKMTDVFEQMQSSGISTYAIARDALPDSVLITSTYFSSTYDPHVWFDVSLWAECARYVNEVLGTLRAEDAEYFEERTTAYLNELEKLDTYIKDQATRIPPEKRVLITSHDAFGYFGEAYDFEVQALQGLSTVTEAGTADVQELAEFVADRQIPALFIESSVSPRGIEAVKAAVESRNFEVTIGGFLYSDALGNPDSPEATFIGTATYNIDTIVNGLSGQALPSE